MYPAANRRTVVHRPDRHGLLVPQQCVSRLTDYIASATRATQSAPDQLRSCSVKGFIVLSEYATFFLVVATLTHVTSRDIGYM